MKVLLIVDDEAYARQAVVNTIPWAEYGVEVHQASSGKEALEFMQKYTVDILMTDIRMPSMTGLELLEKVNQMGISPAVIMLSSYNEFELVRSAMQLGAEDYLFLKKKYWKDFFREKRFPVRDTEFQRSSGRNWRQRSMQLSMFD